MTRYNYAASNIPGVVSDRGAYDFDNKPIEFYVVTKATKELYDENHSNDGFATVTVNVKRAEHYTGTGIKNMTAIVDPDGDAIQMATDYNVVNGDTIYLPINYGFQKTDLIDLKLQLDQGATAQITSQNNPQTDPVTIKGTDIFHDVQTNGRGFTITVTAENGNTAVYRINLVAASKEEANLNRFQIGGDDGQSLAASFDRQNVEDGQFEMTIKVPFGTLKEAVAGYSCSVSGTAGNNVPVDTYQGGILGSTAVADFSAIDKSALATLISSAPNVLDDDTWDGAKVGLQFSDPINKKVQLVLFKSSTEIQPLGAAKTDGVGVSDGVQAGSANKNSTITFGGGVGNVVLNYGNATWTYATSLFHDGANGWSKFVRDDDTNPPVLHANDGDAIRIIDTGLICNVGENPYTVEVGAGKFGDQAVYSLVSNGASAYWWGDDDADGTKTWNPIESSVTKFGDIWNKGAEAYHGTKGVIYILVEHNEAWKSYRIKLEEEAARTGNEIAGKSIIADDAVIGEGDEFEGAPVSGSNLFKVTVPYEWTDTDAYIYKGLELDPGAEAYILTGDPATSTGKLVKVATNATVTPGSPKTYGALNNKILGVQSDVEALDIVDANDIVNNGRRPVVDSLSEKIYVFSEAAIAKMKEDGNYTNLLTATNNNASHLATLAGYGRVYNVYYERKTANNQAQLLTINSSTPGVTASLNNTTKVVTVRVPNSFNWTAFRDKSENDFTVDFTLSEGASMTDNAEVKWASGKTTFFVRDSELCVFDKLTGRTKQITNRDTKHEPQAATLTVSSEDNGKVKNNYSFRLTIAPPSSNANLSKVVVGETEATIGSNGEVTVTLPADSDLAAQDVFITPASAVATVQNEKGEAFDSTVKHDLSEPMKFTITAEDGTKAEYTLTAKVGGSVVDPDKKPSESYTDLDKVYSGLLEKVKAAIDMGLMGSTSTTAFVFAPKADVARKDIAVIIARADLIASNDAIVDSKQADEALKAMYTDGEAAFDDLSKCNDIQKAAIRYCAEKEIIGGDGKGSFNPDGELKREEMAIILTNWTDITVDKNNTTNDEIADWNNVSNWAKPYVNAVYGKMMNGVGNSNFGPKVTVSREQTASMLVDAFGILYPGYGH